MGDAIEKWVLTSKISVLGCADVILRAIDDPKVFLFAELLEAPNVKVRGRGRGASRSCRAALRVGWPLVQLPSRGCSNAPL
jgi:hypothetical protein